MDINKRSESEDLSRTVSDADGSDGPKRARGWLYGEDGNASSESSSEGDGGTDDSTSLTERAFCALIGRESRGGAGEEGPPRKRLSPPGGGIAAPVSKRAALFGRIMLADPLRHAVLTDGKVTGMTRRLNEVTDFVAAGKRRSHVKSRPLIREGGGCPGLVLSTLRGERLVPAIPSHLDALPARHPGLAHGYQLLGVCATHLVARLSESIDYDETLVGQPPPRCRGAGDSAVTVTRAAVAAARRLLLTCVAAIGEVNCRRWDEPAQVPWDETTMFPMAWDSARLSVAILAVWRAGCRVAPGTGRLVGETEWPRVVPEALLELLVDMHPSGDDRLSATPRDAGAAFPDATYLAVLRPEVRAHLQHRLDWRHWHLGRAGAKSAAAAPVPRPGADGY